MPFRYLRDPLFLTCLAAYLASYLQTISGPIVLVAHSYGGFVSRLFADAYLDETAGLVLIESSHEDEIEPYREFYGDRPEGDWVDGGDLLDIDATEAALRHLRGERVPRHIELPVQVVDRANCGPWDKPFEERECPRWEEVVKEEGRR